MKRKILLIVLLVAIVFSVSCQRPNPDTDFEYLESEGITFLRHVSPTEVQIPRGIIITDYVGETKRVVIPHIINDLPVVLIGNSAFINNQLTSITLPNSIIHIGMGAFMDNQLTSITLPNSMTIIEFSAFENNQLTSITIPNSVTHIGVGAFYNNKLTSITIPNSVTHIGTGAFRNNQLTSVIVPNSVIELDPYAFDDNVEIIRR